MDDRDLCSDCPPVGYPTDETRCAPCPRAADAIPALRPSPEIKRLREALKLADALLSGANMNARVVERKVRAALNPAPTEIPNE